MRSGLRCLVGLFLLSVSLAAAAGTFSASLNNDIFVGHDRRYTNGLNLTYLGDARSTGQRGCVLGRVLCRLPGSHGNGRQQTWSMGFQQIMVTPEDIVLAQPNYDELPYLGFSHVNAAIYTWDDKVLTSFGLRLGVVGPSSGAENAQKFIHKLIGANEPEGWGNQLGPSVIGGVYGFQSRRITNAVLEHGNSWAMHVAYGVDANNFLGAVRGAWFIRYGHHLSNVFLSDFTGMSVGPAMVGRFETPYGKGWALFAGVESEYDAYSYLTRRAPASYHLEPQHWVESMVVGGSRRWASVQVLFSVHTSTSMVRERSVPWYFGNVTVLWHLR